MGGKGETPQKKSGEGESRLGDLSGKSVEELTKMVTEQGNKVRQMKAAKQDKKLITEQVEILKQLKSAVEKASKAAEMTPGLTSRAGTKPEVTSNGPPVANGEVVGPSEYSGYSVEELKNMVTEQGNKVRALKAEKPQNKSLIATEVEKLKALKEQQLIQTQKEKDDREELMTSAIEQTKKSEKISVKTEEQSSK